MEWVNTWTRDYGVQYCEVIAKANLKGAGSIASMAEECLIYPTKGNEAFHIPKKDLELDESIMNKFFKNQDQIEKEVGLFNKYGEEYVQFAKETSKLPLYSLSNEELLKYYRKFRELWVIYTSYLWCMFYANEVISQKIEVLLSKKSTEIGEKEFKELVVFASTPDGEAAILRLNRELAVLKKALEEKLLEKILKEYSWIPCLDLHHKPWDKNHLIEYSKDYTHSEKVHLSEEEIIRSSKLTNEEIELIRLNKRFAYIKDLRDEYRRIGIFYIQKLYSEIGKRMNLSLKEMSYTQDKEIEDFVNEGKIPNKEKIHERFNGFLMYTKGKELVCVSGPEIPRIAREELGFEEELVQEEIVQGKSASKGKVRGKVRIVLTSEELGKVKEGDILVAVTTGADYVPAMHRAGAFITDEGGLTCHAAIVAREMKKPCIVGTKNATKILKDGEVVEVDCETGTVKKL